jgi:membrane-bound lytic murein transglycosylase F
MVPTHIPEPDRTWFTLAAYNVGFGHVEDARIIAQTLGKNPDSWADVSEQMPKLAEPRWFARAKCGYAQGWQPVEYVEHVRQFMQLLEWQPDDGVPHVTTADTAPTATGSSGNGDWRSVAALGEEPPQQVPALLHQHATEHVDPVVESR